MENLSKLAYELRKDALDIIMAGKGGHIGGDMSVMEILTVLYFQVMNVNLTNIKDSDHDRFILSKGHAMEAYYAVLAKKGFLDLNDIKEKYGKPLSPYIGHPNNKLLGIEMNSGSLGHGLPVGVGLALAGKMDKKSYRVYVVMGDGEMAEGSIWEALMAGNQYSLNNLCAVIDENKLQISGPTSQVMGKADLASRIRGFGWNVIKVEDGNDVNQLISAFKLAEDYKAGPTCLVCETIKGKGSNVMENKASWHHHLPSEEEYSRIAGDFAIKEREL
ncbi:MAG: transketolase [Bacilli bacterium]|jgi:transketolase|nr:transketolase [Bacilli bacterium]